MTDSDSIKMILSESVTQAQARESRTFSQQLEKADGSVVVYGAGVLGRLCHRALRCAGIPVRAYCDRRADSSAPIDETQVLMPPDAAEQFGRGSLFVVAIWTGTATDSVSDRIDYLRRLGCRHVVSFSALMWAHGQENLPLHSFDLPSRLLGAAADLFAISERFKDDVSLRRFTDELKRRIRGDFLTHTADSDQYFPEFVSLSEHEVVADGGAYNGDTLRTFIERTNHRFSFYYAFEPDRKSAGELARTLARLPVGTTARVFIRNAALSDEVGDLSFSTLGSLNSRVSVGGPDTVATLNLDGVRPEKPFSFVKLDVEGHELRALRGALTTLRVDKPTVAACVYHCPMDIVEIPRLLMDAMPNHRFYFRTHGFDGWESVFYAVRP